MRISVTGKEGFSLVEVVMTLAMISACYIVIAKGLIENMRVNKRVENYSSFLLTAKQYFLDLEETNQQNILFRSEKKEDGINWLAIEFYDEKTNKILDFKGIRLEEKK
jgi:type II secretory pathway component PulJ